MNVQFKCTDCRINDGARGRVRPGQPAPAPVAPFYSYQFAVVDSTGTPVVGLQSLNRQDASATKWVPGTAYDNI